MSLLHVITGLEVGGAERALARLVEFARGEGVRSTVVSLGRGGRVADELRGQGFRVLELGIRRGSISLGALRHLRQVAAQVRPTVIHGWMYHGNLAAAFAARGLATRPALAWNIRQSLVDIRVERPLTRAVIRANALLSRRPHGIIYNSSRSMREHAAIGFRNERAEVIPNGFDVTRLARDAAVRARLRNELGIEDDAVVICCVARYHPVKNHGGLLEAVSQLRGGAPPVRLLLVGTGLDRSNIELTALVERFRLGDVVHLAGEQGDVAPWLAAADVFCLPSLSEAFPNAVGEAMASALPCVVTSVGDVPDLVSDCGWIVPAGDTRALAGALAAAVAAPARVRAELGWKARQRIVDLYSMARIGGGYLDFYRRASLAARSRT